ncbi:MAG TPA: ATP-binding protein, partial [Acidimicrobiia bacterium]|nr:ATP-binding protein [Acidimicrobiia bacterium]
MNLRLRLTLVVAITFALVVVGCTYAAHVSARSRLRAETDQFLVTRADRFAHTPGDDFPQNGGDGDEAGSHGGPSLSDPDAVVRILDSKGRVHSSIAGQPAIPIDRSDRALAEHGGAARFRDVTVKGVPYRVLTVALTGGGAAQIARSTDGDHDVLATLDARLTLIALIGTLVAASMAWAIARRTVKPIEDLTRKATYVAETQDLANPLEIARRDELGRLASSFNTMLEALHTSREQQKRLVLDASHELRTPLTALRTNIDLLRRARSFDADQRAELLTEADLELRELTDLVAELVELATDTRSEEPVDHIDLSELVDRVVTRHRRRSGREIDVEMHEPAVVNGRVALLERAVSNLVENALKFSADDSAISVVVDGSRIEVLDRGAGIAPADLPHVFDRFYRATTARTLPGSGLGLSIVEQIAQMH